MASSVIANVSAMGTTGPMLLNGVDVDVLADVVKYERDETISLHKRLMW
jgi:hypothetical protein